jgi:hypothetical protein
MADVDTLQKRDSIILNMRKYIASMESRLKDLEQTNIALLDKQNVAKESSSGLNPSSLVLTSSNSSKIAADFKVLSGKCAKKEGGVYVLGAVEGDAAIVLQGIEGDAPDIITARIQSYHEKSPVIQYRVNGLQWRNLKAAEKQDAMFFVDKQHQQDASVKIEIRLDSPLAPREYAWCVFSKVRLIWNSDKNNIGAAQIV